MFVLLLKNNIRNEYYVYHDGICTHHYMARPDDGTEICRVIEGVVRGFKKDLLTENLTEREKGLLVCPRCQGILREACISGTGEHFCLSCSYEGEDTHPDIQVRTTVLFLKYSCPMHERGCKWVGNLGECEKHLEVCEYVYEMCKLGCGLVFTRHELKAHSKECSHRIVLCEHCNKEFKYCDLPTHHSMCDKMQVRCELGCDKLVIRENMTQHMDIECGEKEVNCPFVRYGCKVGLIKRKEMNQHLEDNKFEHMVVKVNSLEETISLLSLTVENLLEGAAYDTVHWKVEGITDILERNKSLTSKEFILHGFPMTFTLIASTNPISIRFQIVPSRQKPTLPIRALKGYFITSLLCLNDGSRLVFKSKEYLIGEPTGMLLKMMLYIEGEVATVHLHRITDNYIKDGDMNLRIAFKHCT